MRLSREEVQHIALLARLGLSEAEIEKLQLQLSNILENFEVLREVDTDNLPPTTQSVDLRNVFRADIARESYPTEDILGNAPQRESDYFKTRPVLE